MTETHDYRKADKDLYQPPAKPGLITVPPFYFVMVDGQGDPNQARGEYGEAVSLLYAIAYTIKMSKKSGQTPVGYFEYTLPPLEGLWWFDDGSPYDFSAAAKSRFCWTAMLRLPEFVDDEVFAWALAAVAKKSRSCR